VTVRVLAFARLRELLGFGERGVELRSGATAHDLWKLLAAQQPAIDAFATSARLARNGSLVDGSVTLNEGDEIALLPPVGGG
jgi:molybdopterin converting factor subunit 1